MMIDIKLRIKPRGEYRDLQISEGTTLEALFKDVQEEMEYTALLAKVRNEYKPLDHALTMDDDGAEIELLDMRTHAASQVYQNSLVMICLTAIRNLMPGVNVVVENSINQGLFLSVGKGEHPSEEKMDMVEGEMRRLVDADLPVCRKFMSKSEFARILEEQGRRGSLNLLKQFPEPQIQTVYELDGYVDYMYGDMVPSTGYIQYFTFQRYRAGALLRFPLTSVPNVIPPFNDQEKLYQAFGSRTMWDKLLDIEFVASLNEKIWKDRYEEMILLSEALHEKQIVEIARTISEQKKRIILIAGPSSSGKTTFAKRLCIQLRVRGMRTMYMGTDDYFVERSETPLDANGEPDYENLEAIDIQLFNDNMNDLLAGKEVDLPTFDFMTGTKTFGRRITKLEDNQLIVIEGIHGLNEKMTAQIPKEDKFKIYISPLTQLNIDEHTRVPTTDERMLRRMVRDHQFRGHSAAETIADWPKVRAGENKNIFPYNGEADVLFNSYYDYEIAVLKKYAEPLLRAIGPEEPAYAEARRILKFFSPFQIIGDDSKIANNSILREFIGGSVFVD